MASNARRPQLLFAAAAAFLLMLGLSVLFPVLPFYVRWLHLSEFQAGTLLSVYAAIGVLVSPWWGRFSERRGRKPAILIGLAGFAAGFVLFGLGRDYGELLAARLLGGFFAAAAMPALFAYVADVTPPERRSAAMGIVGAAIGLGIIVGPILGGLLAPLGLRIPFFVAGAIGGLATLAMAIWLPESLHERRQASRAGDRADRRDLLRLVLPLLIYGFLAATAQVGFESILGFYVADRLGGGPRLVGGLLGVVAVVGVGVQGGGVRALSRRFPDRILLVWGTWLMILGFLGLGYAPNLAWAIAGGVVYAIGNGLAMPTFTAWLSREGEHNQGVAQGLGQSARSLGRVTGPLLFTAVYQAAGGTVSFMTAAGLTLGALVPLRLQRRG